MSGDAEVYIESDRTRVVSDIDISSDRNSAPAFSLESNRPRVAVRTQTNISTASIELKNASNSATIAEVGSDVGFGYFTVAPAGGGSSAYLHAAPPNPAVDIPRSNNAAVHLEAGELDIRGPAQVSHRLLEADDTGDLRLRNEDAVETAHLNAQSGVLKLRGSPEINPARDAPSPSHEFGGGELVVSSHGDPDDIHLHAKGEQASSFGVDNNNRPRIILNGPDATLELGRHTLGTDRFGVPGTIRLRDDQHGTPVLDLHAQHTFTRDFVSREYGEVELKYYDDPKLRHRGTIRAHHDGLMIYDAGDNPALLLTPSGDLLTRKSVTVDSSL